MGTKRSVLTDENGLPLAVVLSGANTHDPLSDRPTAMQFIDIVSDHIRRTESQ